MKSARGREFRIEILALRGESNCLDEETYLTQKNKRTWQANLKSWLEFSVPADELWGIFLIRRCRHYYYRYQGRPNEEDMMEAQSQYLNGSGQVFFRE